MNLWEIIWTRNFTEFYKITWIFSSLNSCVSFYFFWLGVYTNKNNTFVFQLYKTISSILSFKKTRSLSKVYLFFWKISSGIHKQDVITYTFLFVSNFLRIKWYIGWNCKVMILASETAINHQKLFEPPPRIST